MREEQARADALFGAGLFALALAPRLYVALAWAGEPVWDGHYYDFGARPALRSRMVASLTPCLAAIAACACHSYCAFKNCPVHRMANSESRGGTLV